MARIIQEWKHFPIAPDPALLNRSVIAPSIPPFRFEVRRIERGAGVRRLQEPAAFRAVVDYFCDGKARAAVRLKANKLSCHEFPIIAGVARKEDLVICAALPIRDCSGSMCRKCPAHRAGSQAAP